MVALLIVFLVSALLITISVAITLRRYSGMVERQAVSDPKLLNSLLLSEQASGAADLLTRGRKPSVDIATVFALHEQGVGGTEIAKQLRIGRASVYRALEG